MKPYKALGVDGLHTGFFLEILAISGRFREIFGSQSVPPYLNQTLIVIIPKQLGPETMGHFRPISLCNIVYKIV